MKSSSLIKFLSSACLSVTAAAAHGMDGKSPVYFEVGTGVSANSGKNTAPVDLSSSDRKFRNKTAVPVSASIGYRYSPNIRWDINVTYLSEWNVNLQGQDSDGDQVNIKSSISSLSSGFNIYYDITNFDHLCVTPYVTGGVGFSLNKVGDSDVFINDNLQAKFSSANNTSFMWKIGAGATKKINETIFIDIGYKFVSLGSAKSKSGAIYINDGFYYNSDTLNFKKLYSHQVLLNMGFNF